MHEPETDWEWSCVVLLQKRKCDGVTMDGWRCKLLDVWKTCVQTDRQTDGWWVESGWRTDSAGWRRRGDGWPDLQSPLFLFIYLFFKPSPPLTRFPRRSSNLLHKKDKPLVLSSASPRAEKMDAVFKKKKGKRSKISSPEDWIRGCFKEALRRFDRSFVDDDVRICGPDRPSLSFLWRWFWQINYFTNNNIQNYEGFQWRTRSSATKRGLNNIIQSSKSLIHLVFSLFIDCLVD